MSRGPTSLDRAYFDRVYEAAPDPWDFRTSAYEDHKYAATLGLLSRARYRSALEVGCSIGVFTRRLAPRCERLLAVDIAEAALAAARTECAELANVSFLRAALPAEFPQGRYDLIVFSEVLYYLSRPDLQAMAARTLECLAPAGEVVLCHWLGPTDYPLSGEACATLFLDATARQLPFRRHIRTPDYRLDLLRAAAP